MTSIVRSDAAAARGPYAPAVLTSDLLFISGQTGRDPATGELPKRLAAQLRHVFDRLSALSQAAGTSIESAVRATVYLSGHDLISGVVGGGVLGLVLNLVV
jgi:2-iminobutanoate/2-iminopropanoate deaminase